MCTRPWLSVTGTRWTRCTPPSNLSSAYGASPGSGVPLAFTATVTDLYPPRSDSVASRISVDQPRVSAYRVYMRSRSPANSADSSPPSPDLISSSTSLPSEGSRGISSWRSRSSAVCRARVSSSASRANDSSSPASSRAASRSPPSWTHSSCARRTALSSAYRCPSLRASDWSECTEGSASLASSSACSAASCETASNIGGSWMGDGFPGDPGKCRFPAMQRLGTQVSLGTRGNPQPWSYFLSAFLA